MQVNIYMKYKKIPTGYRKILIRTSLQKYDMVGFLLSFEEAITLLISHLLYIPEPIQYIIDYCKSFPIYVRAEILFCNEKRC